MPYRKSISYRIGLVVSLLTLLLIFLSPAKANVIFIDDFDTPEALDLYPRIEFLSDQLLLFQGVGGSGELAVRVYDADGEEIPDAQVGWRSADPNAVAIEALGPLSATVHADAPWSGAIPLTVEYPPLGISARAQAVQAVLAPETVYLSSVQLSHSPARGLQREVDALILDIQGNRAESHRIILQRALTTEALQIGDILLSGDQAGIMVHILDRTLEPDRVVLDVEPALITEAFQELDLMLEGEPLELTLHVAPRETTLTIRSLRDDVILRRQILPRVNLLNNLKCTGGLDIGGELGITTLELKRELTPLVALNIVDSTVVDFLMQIEGMVGIAAGFAVNASGGATLSGTCNADIPPIRLPAIPLSAFSLEAIINPGAGVNLQATAEASAQASTPRLDRSWSAKAGVRYTNAQGWETISEGAGQDNSSGAFSGSLEGGLQLDGRLYAQVGTGLNFLLGRGPLSVVLVSVEFFELNGGPHLAFGIETPADPTLADYTGPLVDVGIGARAGAQLKANLFAGQLGNYLPLDLAVDLNIELFSEQAVLYQSPKPSGNVECDPDCQKVPVDGSGSVTLTAAADTDESGTVEFWASHNGADGLMLLETAAFSGRQAEATFTPDENTEGGKYTVYPRLKLDGPWSAYTHIWPLASVQETGEFTVVNCNENCRYIWRDNKAISSYVKDISISEYQAESNCDTSYNDTNENTYTDNLPQLGSSAPFVSSSLHIEGLMCSGEFVSKDGLLVSYQESNDLYPDSEIGPCRYLDCTGTGNECYFYVTASNVTNYRSDEWKFNLLTGEYIRTNIAETEWSGYYSYRYVLGIQKWQFNDLELVDATSECESMN